MTPNKDILFIGLDPDAGSPEPVSVEFDVWKNAGASKYVLDKCLFGPMTEVEKGVFLSPVYEWKDPLTNPSKPAENPCRNKYAPVTDFAKNGADELRSMYGKCRAALFYDQVRRDIRSDAISLSNPPSVSVKVRKSGSVVVEVNLKRGGFTCFLKPPDFSKPTPFAGRWSFGFAFRAPTDEPSSKGKELASHRCGRLNVFMQRPVYVMSEKPSRFAGTVDGTVLQPISGNEKVRLPLTSWLGTERLLTLRALRSLRKSGAFANVRWWTKDSMDQAVALLREGTRTYRYKIDYVDREGKPSEPTEPPTETIASYEPDPRD